PSTALGVMLTNILPPTVSFVSSSADQGSCMRTGNVLNCSLGSISNRADARITITVTATNAGFVTNITSVSTSTTDLNLANNASVISTRVNSPPAISSIANQTINEDTSTGPIAFTVSDRETSTGNLILLATSS